MRVLLTIVVAALAALGANVLASPGPEAAARASGDAQRAVDLGKALETLQAENRALVHAIEQRESALAAPAAPRDELGDADMAAALARWRTAHPADAKAIVEKRLAPPRPASDALDLAAAPMADIVALLSRRGLTHAETQEIFQRLRDAKRIDEYVAAIEKLAAEDPKNADLQVALGNAYLQKIFDVGHGPEAGKWATKSDLAFDRALAIDDHNWPARFTKAVALSNWPPFLGKGPAAIENFETLIEQQSAVPARPEFALTYLFLGNVYQANGDKTKALATWRAGLELFPERKELQSAVELATGEGGR